uniref:Si:ch73-22o12.1 n=1 Tax=Paramormyrops kingsleyae TaxID=1676925 RepID=A0A3B3T8V0_9TELE|nr:nectin-2 isoform X2 [Paramormyrops kingsleyae]
MEKNNARNSPSFAFLLIIFGLAIQDAFSQRVKVQPEVVSYPGQTVSLQCEYPNQSGTALTQVSWIWEPADGKRDNIAVYHPDFGPSYPSSPLIGRVTFVKPSLTNPSITISDVKMTDEGRYICEYATYPSGNEQGTTTLIMLAKPENNGSAITAVAGNTSTVVARCQSANGRPPAKITWISPFNGNDTVVTKPGTSNTVTVISEYRLVPTAADDGKEIKCVIEHRTQSKNEEISMKLAIEYLPKVSITGYDENWYMGRSSATLMCQAFGNPPPSIAWKTTSGPLPANVQVQEAYLTVPKVDDTMNTTFVCEATNQRGTASHHLTVMVRETQLPLKGSTTGAVIGGVTACIILVAVIVTVVVMILKRRRKEDTPPKHKPPPPMKTSGSAEKPNAGQASETQPLGQTYNSQTEPVTNLDDADYQKNGHGEDSALSGSEDRAHGRYQDNRELYGIEPRLHYSASREGGFISPPITNQ